MNILKVGYPSNWADPRDARGMTQEKAAAQAEEAIRVQEELEAQRKLDSKELAGETIKRELAESGFICHYSPNTTSLLCHRN